MAGQSDPFGALAASSCLKPALPAEQSAPSAGPAAGKPFGPSTLCGSHWIEPQLLTVPLAQSFARLMG